MSETRRFKIGDMAWMAEWTSREAFVRCPDCGGTGRIRVTFHDDTEASIGCGNCAPGYDPPTGKVRVYDRTPRATHVHINGMEIGPTETRWRLGYSENCYQMAQDDRLFTSEADALVFAAAECAKLDEADRQKVLTKEKDTRTWAWNASYHRKQIKEAEKNLTYHRSKLAVAAIKAKSTADGDGACAR